MLPIIPKPPITRKQKLAALSVAGTVDFLQIAFLPLLGLGYVLDDVLDVLAALLLMVICGFKWQFILAFILELVPVFDLLPTWTAVVLLLPVEQGGRINAAEANVHDTQYPPIDVTAVVVPPVKGEESGAKR